MIETAYYTNDFFASQQAGSHSSAKIVLPIVQQVFHPKSVIDIGCGVGYWLKVWQDDLQVEKVQGVEGPYISPEMLQINKEFVLFKDLKEPLNLHEKYDLAMSLEVAEHLPQESAIPFVKTLTSLSDVVLFSAAIEGQEGTYHINEQMPEYWSRIFNQFGYIPVDYIRPKIWGNEKVEWWYQQNLLLYIKASLAHLYPELDEARKSTNPESLLRIHPWIFWYKNMHIKKISSWEGFLRWKLYPFKRALLKWMKK